MNRPLTHTTNRPVFPNTFPWVFTSSVCMKSTFGNWSPENSEATYQNRTAHGWWKRILAALELRHIRDKKNVISTAIFKRKYIDVTYLVHTPDVTCGIMIHIENAVHDSLCIGRESSHDVCSLFQVSCRFSDIYHRLASSRTVEYDSYSR